MRAVPFALLLALAACDASTPDVVGPFTGEVHRYYLDDVTIARSGAQARMLGDDLSGDQQIDNLLGYALASLSVQGNDLTTHARDIIAAGVITSTLEIQADDLMNDGAAGVTFLGGSDDAIATVAGGRLDHGVFVSNRTASSDVLGRTTVHLPALVDADPAVFVLDDMEIDLTPDGSGGYNGLVRGLASPDVLRVAAGALVQMIENDPADHADLIGLLAFDRQHEGPLTVADIEQDAFYRNLLQPDVMRDGAPYLSFGYGVHFSPTPPATTIADTCHDRIHDANETGIDCGGSCLACAGGQTCGTDGDCQSQSCDGTRCAAASCADHVHDGVETDVDCGGWECARCLGGYACQADSDCVSGRCIAGGCD